MRKAYVNTVKTVLVIIAFPFALTAVAVFMLYTFGKMAVGKLVSAR